MINNKKVFLIYIICFFLFLTLYIFPNYSNQPRLLAFQVKDSIEKIVQKDGSIGGYNGTYVLGEELYEYLNGVVKKLK